MTPSELAKLIEDSGFDTRRYSGRGMCGDECVGFYSEYPMSDAAEVVACAIDEESRHALADAFKEAKTDDMGTGTIVYFPRFKYLKV